SRRAAQSPTCTAWARSARRSSSGTRLGSAGSPTLVITPATTRPRPSPRRAPSRTVTGSTPRGNRQLNRAIHVAAVTQVAHDTDGRAYYLRKLAEGKTRKEALRALKRQISNAVYRRPVT